MTDLISVTLTFERHTERTRSMTEFDLDLVVTYLGLVGDTPSSHYEKKFQIFLKSVHANRRYSPDKDYDSVTLTFEQ